MKYFIAVICLGLCSCQPKFNDSVEAYNEINRAKNRVGVAVWNTGVRVSDGTKKVLDGVTDATSPKNMR